MIGNEAAALAAKMANPQVVAAYPLTPQKSIDVIYVSAKAKRTVQRLLKNATKDMQTEGVTLPTGAKRTQTVFLSRVRGTDARVIYREPFSAAGATDPGKKDADLSKHIVREIAAGKFAAMVIDISFQNADL